MTDINFYPHLNNDAVTVLGAAAVATIILNLIPPFYRSFHLFFTMIHELGHVFATRLTNGIVKGFWVIYGKGGYAKREGGEPLWIIPAGYMGVTLFSAGLILMSGLPYIAPYTLGVLGGLLMLFVFLYARHRDPEENNEDRFPVTAIVGVTSAVIFIGVAWLTHLVWSVFLLYLLAIQGIFITLKSLEELALQVRRNMKNIDPDQMAKLVGCSPMFWTRAWTLASILILGATFWFTWLRNWPQ